LRTAKISVHSSLKPRLFVINVFIEKRIDVLWGVANFKVLVTSFHYEMQLITKSDGSDMLTKRPAHAPDDDGRPKEI
jgi:hypothetical protein